MLNSKSYPTLAVQGCHRSACDCEVHARAHHDYRYFLPTEPVRIYREHERGMAMRVYRRRFPKALKVIAAVV